MKHRPHVAKYAPVLALLLGLGIGTHAAFAASADSVQTIDPVTGKSLVTPQDSALSEDVNEGPPNAQPPPYTILRYTENYSYLANPANRSDFFDPAKYIPLNPSDPYSYLSFGGEMRERFEDYRNQSFGTISGLHDNDYLLQRITLDTDLHVNERLRFFVQGISGLQFGGYNKPAVDQDPANLQQAFVDYTFGNPTLEGDRFTVRGGRFEMTYGSGRLVATRAAPDIPFKFDGFQFIASSENTTKLYGFLTHPVTESNVTVDRTDYGQGFWGLYGTTPIGGPLNTSIDLYYLGYRNDNAHYADASGLEDRHSVGTRLFGKVQSWDYDIEPVFQFGSVGSSDIRAWTFASDAGYRFAQTPWNPRIGSKFDIASGDSEHGNGTLGTFNPLYFKSGYFDDASLFRPSNIVDVHPNLQIEPEKDTTLTFGSDVVWRYSTQDGLYAPPGNMVLPASAGSNYVGTTAEAAVQYRIDRHATVTASYVHMFTGQYVAGAKGGDIDYFGTWLSYLW
ncbi:MAG: alginate export family protein [Alphaproteobacteria bacterium]